MMEGATHFSVNFLTAATCLEAASRACLQVGVAGCRRAPGTPVQQSAVFLPCSEVGEGITCSLVRLLLPTLEVLTRLGRVLHPAEITEGLKIQLPALEPGQHADRSLHGKLLWHLYSLEIIGTSFCFQFILKPARPTVRAEVCSRISILMLL